MPALGLRAIAREKRQRDVFSPISQPDELDAVDTCAEASVGHRRLTDSGNAIDDFAMDREQANTGQWKSACCLEASAHGSSAGFLTCLLAPLFSGANPTSIFCFGGSDGLARVEL